MNVHDYLRDGRRIQKMIPYLNKKLVRVGNRTERSMAKVVNECQVDESWGAIFEELEKEHNLRIQLLNSLFEMITRSIEAVPDPRYRTILTMRYLQRASWKEVQEALYTNRKWLWELEQRAMTHIRVAPEYISLRTQLCEIIGNSRFGIQDIEQDFLDSMNRCAKKKTSLT